MTLTTTTRLESIHTLLCQISAAYHEALGDPTSGANVAEVEAQFHEVRDVFAAELSRVIFSIQAEVADPSTILSTPSNLRDAIGRALGADATDAIGDDTLRGAARTLLSS